MIRVLVTAPNGKVTKRIVAKDGKDAALLVKVALDRKAVSA